MITIEQIFDIGNCEIQTYSGYKWAKDNVPGYSGNHDQMIDLEYPECKNIHYSDLSVNIPKLSTVKDTLIDRDVFLIPGYLQYGDYDNSCMVERSNQKLFLESYEECPGVFTITGGYGSSGIAISIKWLLDPANEETAREIIDLLNDLNDYPCIDDEDMCSMEYETFLEALDNYEIGDFIQSAGSKFNLDISDYDQDKARELILEIDRNLPCPSYTIESGGICYIDNDRLIEPLTIDQLKPVLSDYEVVS